MKKYILGLAVLVGGVFASCDTDNEGTIYRTTAQNISFENAEPATVVTKASSVTVPVSIVRTNTSGEYTVHYTLSSEDAGIFSDANNGTLTFAAGEWSKTFNIEASNMKGGTLYTCKLALSDADALTADTVLNKKNAIETTINVMCDYTWVSIGKGFYSSPEWWEEEFDVEIEKAEGANVYKIVSLFEKGYDIQFSIGADNVVIVQPQASWKHSSYGVVTLEGFENQDKSYVAGTYDPTTKQVALTLRHYVSAGSFGAYTDTLTLP